MRALSTCLLVVLSVQWAFSARILGIFPFPSPSHRALGTSLLKALAARGHNVTMLSPYPLKESVPNYRDIYIDGVIEFRENELDKVFSYNATFMQKLTGLKLWLKLTEVILESNGVQNLLKSNEEFDLVIHMVLLNPPLLGIADHFKAPVIGVSTVGASEFTGFLTGSTLDPSYIPTLMCSFPSEMNFPQRLLNTVAYVYNYINREFIVDDRYDEILHNHFPNAPPIRELYKRVALMFLNSHYSYESPKPYLPNMIPIGGVHVQEVKELPESLKSFIEGARDGAIYFSLGSNIKASELPQDIIKSFMKTFSELPQRVLWKFDGNITNLPKNVKVSTWFPQNDILAHPNIKAFVTHGGLLSTIEAIYHGVPLVGIPLFADQKANVVDAAHKGYAIRIDLEDITYEAFSKAIQEILNNSSYRENIRFRSSLMKGDFVKPMDRAMYWTEHVLKYGGGKHLQNYGVHLKWYQYYLLDVISFLLGVFVVLLTLNYFIVKKLFSILKKLVFRSKVKSE